MGWSFQNLSSLTSNNNNNNNNNNKLCARPPQYATALLRRTLRPSTPYACGAQRALLPVAVGSMNIRDVRDRQTSDVVRRQTDVRRAS